MNPAPPSEWTDDERETLQSITNAGVQGTHLAMGQEQTAQYYAHLRAAQGLVIASAALRRKRVINVIHGLVMVVE